MGSYSTRKMLDLPAYTEGPAVGRNGALYFTTLSAGGIGTIDPNGDYRQWASGTCPNGQIILPDGEHWFCDSASASITRYSPAGKFIGNLVQEMCGGVQVCTPNDLVLDSAGNLYFTDSIRDDGKVFFKSCDGYECPLAERIDYANGIALSADERFLFVAESFRNRILRIELAGPGKVRRHAEVFAELPAHGSGKITDNMPDGLAIDNEGRLWVAHYGMGAVQVISPTGILLLSLETQMPLTSNLSFILDKPRLKTLLVTGGYQEPGPGAVVELIVHFP